MVSHAPHALRFRCVSTPQAFRIMSRFVHHTKPCASRIALDICGVIEGLVRVIDRWSVPEATTVLQAALTYINPSSYPSFDAIGVLSELVCVPAHLQTARVDAFPQSSAVWSLAESPLASEYPSSPLCYEHRQTHSGRLRFQ